MSNFQQMLFKFLDRPSQAGVATSAFMQGLQQARESKLQRERIAAQERRLDFDIQKANRDFQKEQIKNFETVGQNTAQAFGTAFEELNSNDSRANRVRVWKQLKGLQRDGLISDQVTIDPNFVLDPDADFKGFLQETSRELTTRFEGPTDLSTEARQIAEGAGLDVDSMSRQDLLLDPRFVAERRRREKLALGKAKASGTVITNNLRPAVEGRAQEKLLNAGPLIANLEDLGAKADPRFFALGGMVRTGAAQLREQMASIPGLGALSGEESSAFLEQRSAWLADSNNMLLELQALVKGIPSDKDQEMINRTLKGFDDGSVTVHEVQASIKAAIRRAKKAELAAARALTGDIQERAKEVLKKHGEKPPKAKTSTKAPEPTDPTEDFSSEELEAELRRRGLSVE